MDERRRLPRKYLAVYSRVFDRESGVVLGYLSDLSLRGAMIISDTPLQENSTAHLRLDLPVPPLLSQPHIDIDALVAWSSRDIDPAFYNVGFAFLEVSTEQEHILQEMMKAYEFNRGDQENSSPPAL